MCGDFHICVTRMEEVCTMVLLYYCELHLKIQQNQFDVYLFDLFFGLVSYTSVVNINCLRTAKFFCFQECFSFHMWSFCLPAAFLFFLWRLLWVSTPAKGLLPVGGRSAHYLKVSFHSSLLMSLLMYNRVNYVVCQPQCCKIRRVYCVVNMLCRLVVQQTPSPHQQ